MIFKRVRKFLRISLLYIKKKKKKTHEEERNAIRELKLQKQLSETQDARESAES